MKRALKIALLKRGCGSQLSAYLGNVISKHADDLTREFHVQIWNTLNRRWTAEWLTQRTAAAKDLIHRMLVAVVGEYVGYRIESAGRRIRRYKDPRVLRRFYRDEHVRNEKFVKWRWVEIWNTTSIDDRLEMRKLLLDEEGIKNCLLFEGHAQRPEQVDDQ